MLILYLTCVNFFFDDGSRDHLSTHGSAGTGSGTACTAFQWQASMRQCHLLSVGKQQVLSERPRTQHTWEMYFRRTKCGSAAPPVTPPLSTTTNTTTTRTTADDSCAVTCQSLCKSGASTSAAVSAPTSTPTSTSTSTTSSTKKTTLPLYFYEGSQEAADKNVHAAKGKGNHANKVTGPSHTKPVSGVLLEPCDMKAAKCTSLITKCNDRGVGHLVRKACPNECNKIAHKEHSVCATIVAPETRVVVCALADIQALCPTACVGCFQEPTINEESAGFAVYTEPVGMCNGVPDAPFCTDQRICTMFTGWNTYSPCPSLCRTCSPSQDTVNCARRTMPSIGDNIQVVAHAQGDQYTPEFPLPVRESSAIHNYDMLPCL